MDVLVFLVSVLNLFVTCFNWCCRIIYWVLGLFIACFVAAKVFEKL